EANMTTASKRVPFRRYAPVDVTVIASSSSTGLISIRARGVDGNSHDYTGLRWGDEATMWAACPSTLTGATDPDHVGAVPAVNTAGTLYLSQDFIQATPAIDGTPKFPDELDLSKNTAPLRVAPTR